MSEFLKSLPFFNVLADIVSDYPLVSGGLILVIAGLIPYTGIDNANALQEAVFAFALVIAAGGSLWDAINEWRFPTPKK